MELENDSISFLNFNEEIFYDEEFNDDSVNQWICYKLIRMCISSSGILKNSVLSFMFKLLIFLKFL